MSKLKVLSLLFVALILTSCTKAPFNTKIHIDGKMSDTVNAVNTPKGQPDDEGYYLAAQNERFSLYYEEKGLTVKIKNNITGVITTSSATPDESSSLDWKNFVNSGIVLEYYKGTAVNINKINMYSGKPVTKITLIENGFVADINFKTIGISLKMFVTLDEKGINVKIPNSSVREANEQYHLAAIYVFPFLGYTHSDEIEGYMLIPDGCGAVIELKDNNKRFTQPYKAKVYGGNYSVESNTATVQKFDDTIATASGTANVFAPIFGMVHMTNQTAVLGVVEDGKYNCEIVAYPNGVITEYNWITARYIYREVYKYLTGQTGSISSPQENRETFDISVNYRFEDGESADYVGLAKSYRNYLTEKGMLNTSADTSYSLRLDFFGGDEEKSLLGKKTVAMTTVSQIDEILSELTDKGIKDLLVSLKGWQKGGIYGEVSEKLDFDNSIGSYKEYEQLAEKYKDNAEFMLYGDFLNSYKKSGTKDYIYQYNGKVFGNDTFLKLHPQNFRFTADSVSEKLDFINKKLGDDIGISFDGITNEVYSYSMGEKMKMYSRNYAANITQKSMEIFKGKVPTSFFSPNDYLWKITEKYYDYKLYGSDYKFVKSEIPFFAIVLNGSIPLYSEYVNFKADTTEYKLKLIESGVYPSFLLTYQSPSELIYTDSAAIFSCQYSEYKQMINEYNEIFVKMSKITNGSIIKDHISKDGVAVTTYENGAEIIVNYNNTPTDYNGNTVEGQSYLFLDGKAAE